MHDRLLDELLRLHGRPGEDEAAFLVRLRVAESQLTELYRCSEVSAGAAYDQPMIRAAYLLRYLPHYTLQLGDLLCALEGEPCVARVFTRQRLRHAALCGGPAPEPIALAVLHHQDGGRQLHTTVLDQRAESWRDCWPIGARVAMELGPHPSAEIDGQSCDLAHLPTPEETAVLASCQVLTLMNGLNELMKLGAATLSRSLAARFVALPAGALVLVSDQAQYRSCEQGMALLKRLLLARGARVLLDRSSWPDRLEMENRLTRTNRLQGLYGRAAGPDGPATNNYRIWNRQLQLAAVLP